MKPIAVTALQLLVVGAYACCGVGSSTVRFTGQRDLIVWDAARKVEHFVREASFDSSGDLGFLAPVPNVPTLAEASPQAFHIVDSVVSRNSAAAGADNASASAGVEVVTRQNVAGYEAAVLRAGDPGMLRKWLTKNGFPAPSWMEAWAAPYLAKKWPIVAFRVRKGEFQRPVRMTFSTETPFAPYAIPKENAHPDAYLRLDLISTTSLVGKVGGRDWGAKKNGSGQLSDSDRAELAGALALSPNEIPEDATVTSFLDGAFGQESRHDLSFEPVSQMAIVPVGAVGGGLLLTFLGLRGRPQTRRRTV